MEGKEEEEWRHSIAIIPAEKIQDLVLKDKIDYEDTSLDIGATKASSKLASESIDDDYEKPDRLADDFEKEVSNTSGRFITFINHVFLCPFIYIGIIEAFR